MLTFFLTTNFHSYLYGKEHVFLYLLHILKGPTPKMDIFKMSKKQYISESPKREKRAPY
jgi:hypothetical protein